MNLGLNLPPELESKLAAEAANLGLRLPENALRVHGGERSAHPALFSGAELVAYWQSEGLVGTRPEIMDASAYARALREHAQTRVWQ